MSNWTQKSVTEMVSALQTGEVTAVELTQAHLDRIAETEPAVHAYLHISGDAALATAAEVDADRQAGTDLPRLAGIPIALKDLVVTKDMPTTAASRMLENWKPPYDATVTRKIREARMPILGKTNLDEFAMGSSTEYSAFGPTHNPWNLDLTAGGSGGGSAAAVAVGSAPLAIGSDTGGSIRQPAAFTGTVGVKPTYGAVSRYGAVAMASSLDQLGPCARTVLDAAYLYEVMAGHDRLDDTSLDEPVAAVVDAAQIGANGDLTGLRVGVIRQLMGHASQPGVQARFDAALAEFEAAGAEIVEIDCPNLEYALAAYYLILPAEVSSNLARFDAVRFGTRVAAENVEKMMSKSRGAGFGEEVKRRILLGTHALFAQGYPKLYGPALQARTLIVQDFAQAFTQVDVMVSPTVLNTAFELGSRANAPLDMYHNDLATIPANLAGLGALSIPAGLATEDNLPVGLQVIAPTRADARLFKVGAAIEARLQADWGGKPLSALLPFEAEVK